MIDKSNREEAKAVSTSHLMSSSVTTKALQRGCAVLSHTPGFFSTAAVSCPVTGAGLVCRALAMAESSVLSEHAGPTPTVSRGKQRGTLEVRLLKYVQLWIVNVCHILWLFSLCKPWGRSILFTSSSAISNAFNPLNFLSQNSWRLKRKIELLSCGCSCLNKVTLSRLKIHVVKALKGLNKKH